MAARRPFPPLLHMFVAILAIMAIPLAATAFFTRIPEPPVATLDPAPVLARAAAVWPDAVAPTNLPQGWQCTRARFTAHGDPGLDGQPVPGNTLGLGYLTPEQRYIALDRRDAAAAAFVAAVSRQGRPDGETTIAGVRWQRYTSADGRTHSLVRRSGDGVTLVSGDVPFEALAAFLGTLAPVRG